MTRTYYECLNDDGKPATKKQQTLYGTSLYGYRTRLRAELSCPDGCYVQERHEDGSNDWSGRIVSIRETNGHLRRVA